MKREEEEEKKLCFFFLCLSFLHSSTVRDFVRIYSVISQQSVKPINRLLLLLQLFHPRTNTIIATRRTLYLFAAQKFIAPSSLFELFLLLRGSLPVATRICLHLDIGCLTNATISIVCVCVVCTSSIRLKPNKSFVQRNVHRHLFATKNYD